MAHPGPTVLVLSRQDVPVVTDGSAVATGAGIVTDDGGAPDVVLVATGSEVGLCVTAADTLRAAGHRIRVVSMPSWDRFADLDATACAAILPPGVPTVSVEAASTFGWSRWADVHIGIDRFGASAPGDEVLARLGVNADAIVTAARDLLGEAHS
jgi:transketolase